MTPVSPRLTSRLRKVDQKISELTATVASQKSELEKTKQQLAGSQSAGKDLEEQKKVVATCLRLYAVAGGKEGLRFTQPYLGFEWIEAASFRVPLNLLIDPLSLSFFGWYAGR